MQRRAEERHLVYDRVFTKEVLDNCSIAIAFLHKLSLAGQMMVLKWIIRLKGEGEIWQMVRIPLSEKLASSRKQSGAGLSNLDLFIVYIFYLTDYKV